MGETIYDRPSSLLLICCTQLQLSIIVKKTEFIRYLQGRY